VKIKAKSHDIQSLHGPIRVSCYAGALFIRVHGPGVPTVEIRGAETRSIKLPTITVGGEPARTDMRERPFKRSSSKIEVATHGRVYLLKPTGSHRAMFQRDGRLIADAHGPPSPYAEFGPGWWPRRPHVEARLIWRSGVDPLDVVLGHALTAGFGVGARGLPWNLTGALLDCVT
jgi:hypothetical protein